MGTETQLVKVEHLYKEFDENTKVLEDTQMSELPDSTDKGKNNNW